MSSFAYIDGKELTRFSEPLFSDNDLPYRTFALASLETEDDICTLRFDLDHVPEQAIETACSVLADHRGRVRLCLYKAGWFEEHFSSAQAAIKRIVQAVALKEVIITGPFLSKRHTNEQIPAFMKSILHNPMKAAHLLTLSELDLGHSFPLVAVGSNSVMASVMGHEWVARGKYDFGPNASADRSITRAYVSAQESYEPYFDVAMVRLMPSDPEPRWMHYQRMIWRHKIEDGKEFMANLCIKRGQGLDYFLGQDDRPVS